MLQCLSSHKYNFASANSLILGLPHALPQSRAMVLAHVFVADERMKHLCQVCRERHERAR